MNTNFTANMLCDINDVVETLKIHSFNKEIKEDYHESQFEEEPKTLMDIPKDWEGTSFTVGDCLLNLQAGLNELHAYFETKEEN
jgi:hypothetical protein